MQVRSITLLGPLLLLLLISTLNPYFYVNDLQHTETPKINKNIIKRHSYELNKHKLRGPNIQYLTLISLLEKEFV